MTEPEITVYGAYWCPDCRQSKKFLREQLIEYHWVDIDQDKAAEDIVVNLNNGKRIIPTIVFTDGSHLTEPSNAELARKLGLQTEPKLHYYDLAIVGAGPAGLTAAFYAAREGLETLVIERSGLGGQAGVAGGIENFPGFPEGISGQELTDRLVRQARRFGVEILQAVNVTEVSNHKGYKCIKNSEGEHLHAGAALFATGATYMRLGVPGEDDFIGAGVHFCTTCDGPFYKGAHEIVVVGGGNSACEESLQLTKFAEKVTMLVRGQELKASYVLIDQVLNPDSRVDVRFNTVVEAFEGADSKLETVRTCDTSTGETRILHPAAAFIFIGQKPNSDIVQGYVKTDPWGFILTGHDLTHNGEPAHGRAPFDLESSVPGIFAIGDVRHGSTKQVASASGEGAAAALMIRDYLKTG